jgi:hypothetical protein
MTSNTNPSPGAASIDPSELIALVGFIAVLVLTNVWFFSQALTYVR